MKTRSAWIVLGLCGLAMVPALAPPAAAGPDAQAPAWKIAGQLEEACTCDSACPCWFGSKPTKMSCGGGQVLFIEKGTYGDVPLDGLAMANMAQSPKGKSMMESFGEWDYSYLYIDEKASPEQRKALEAVGRIVLPVAASKKVEVRTAPITRTVDDKLHKISLGQYGSFSGHVIDGGLGGSSKIVNPPGADPLHAEYLQGNNTQLVYKDAGQNINVSGTNYMFANFVVDSEQYAKFTAGLSQKMEAMKKEKAGGGK